MGVTYGNGIRRVVLHMNDIVRGLKLPTLFYWLSRVDDDEG